MSEISVDVDVAAQAAVEKLVNLASDDLTYLGDIGAGASGDMAIGEQSVTSTMPSDFDNDTFNQIISDFFEFSKTNAIDMASWTPSQFSDGNPGTEFGNKYASEMNAQGDADLSGRLTTEQAMNTIRLTGNATLQLGMINASMNLANIVPTTIKQFMQMQ